MSVQDDGILKTSDVESPLVRSGPLRASEVRLMAESDSGGFGRDMFPRVDGFGERMDLNVECRIADCRRKELRGRVSVCVPRNISNSIHLAPHRLRHRSVGITMDPPPLRGMRCVM